MEERADEATAHRGFFPVVAGSQVDVTQAGVVATLARGDVSIRQGGGHLLATAGDLTIEQGGGHTLLAKGDVSIRQGGALSVTATNVEVHDGFLGVALAPSVQLDDSKVLLGPVQALCLGLGVGLVLGLVQLVTRRRGG